MDGSHRSRLAGRPARGVPALFLDRDGTLIDDPGYLADPEGVRPYANIGGALRRFREAGYAFVLVTNQSGIGRGYLGWPEYDAVAARLRDVLAREGVQFDAELVCGHTPEEGEHCGWRKPQPGMVREAARLLDLDLSRSLLAGDRLLDMQTAAAAGLTHAVHVATGRGRAEREAIRAWRPRSMRITEVDDLSALSPCAS